MSETAIEESPEYQQVKQRIKQSIKHENRESLVTIKFHQGEFGYDRFDESFEVPEDEPRWSIFVYGLLAILLTWAIIGVYHYYDALYSVLALGGYNG